MGNRRPRRRDPLEVAIELALQPGRFISYGAAWDFVSSLERVARQLDKLLRADPGRAVALYDAFLAGCYEKAEELDDSSGNFGMLVALLHRDWVRARQAASADAEETARRLLDRLENDPYGFAHSLEREVVKVMNTDVLAGFARQVRARFDSVDAVAPPRSRAPVPWRMAG